MIDRAEIVRRAPTKQAAYQALFDEFTSQYPEAALLEADWPSALEQEWARWVAVLRDKHPS